MILLNIDKIDDTFNEKNNSERNDEIGKSRYKWNGHNIDLIIIWSMGHTNEIITIPVDDVTTEDMVVVCTLSK